MSWVILRAKPDFSVEDVVQQVNQPEAVSVARNV